jgi:cellulose synthase/poly-beta-1,6-N-acetylglucosamine synthase-like glycosyltransferase
MNDTITEDTDMAYRVQLMRWKATFAEDAICLEEVPPNYYAAVKRFKRHIKGTIQNLIKHGIAILKHRNLSLLMKIEGLIQLSYPLVYPLGLICLLLTVAAHISIPGALIDHFWLSPAGLLCSLAMLLTFPYIALIISFVISALVIAVVSLFALIFLIKYRSNLRGINLKTIFGAALVWNDNILNCLAPILEITLGKESVWLPTERSLSENKNKRGINKGRFREAALRIAVSILIFIAFALSLRFNFSFNSFGLLVPAVLWICSAYLILRK